MTLSTKTTSRLQRLRLSFAADNCSDLLPLLERAIGVDIAGRYQIRELLAAGSQFFVWLATENSTRQLVVLKQARYDYRYPVRYGRADVEARRDAVRREYRVLLADRTETLPRPSALVVADAPVPAASASPVLAKDEPFVAEEYLNAMTLTDLALSVWPALAIEERERNARALTVQFLEFWEHLQAADWYYGDLSSDNLVVESAGRLRVVDGGSVVPMGESIVLPGFTPSFMTPNLYEMGKARVSVPSSLPSVLPLLGKVLHFALTRREPLNGKFPRLDDPSLLAYSRDCRRVIELFLYLDRDPNYLQQARDALSKWENQRL